MLVRVHLVLRDPPLQRRLRRILDPLDVVVTADASKKAVSASLEGLVVDLCITHGRLLGDAGQELLAQLRELPDAPELVVLTDASATHARSEFLMHGVRAVLGTDEPDETLHASLAEIVARRAERGVLVQRADEVQLRAGLTDVVASSPKMQAFLRIAEKVRRADSTVLLTGATGVGKEWIARAIHAGSSRADGPFIAVNCSAIPDALFESELFGHEAGAFTDARQGRRGRFELAHGGTIFLDEIGDMPSHMQVKLLRVLQERELERLGSEEAVALDVRVMAATNVDLELAVAERRFRADLYYRLAVVVLDVPTLADRREDIPDLVERHLDRLARTIRHHPMQISDDALSRLQAYAWPGNVRELANVLERAVLLADADVIRVEDLPDKIAARPVDEELLEAPIPIPAAPVAPAAPELQELPWTRAKELVLDAFARDYFESALQRNGGHIGATARATGMNPRSLYEKLRRLGLDKRAFKARRLEP